MANLTGAQHAPSVIDSNLCFPARCVGVLRKFHLKAFSRNLNNLQGLSEVEGGTSLH